MQGMFRRFFLYINSPEPLQLEWTKQDVSCGGASDGAVITSVSGGTAPYLFGWDNGENTQSISGLSGGLYYLDCHRSNACAEVAVVEVQEPEPIVITAELTQPNCAGYNNGSINLNVIGGQMPYQFAWSNKDSNEDVTDLIAGTYSVTVTRRCRM